MNWYNLKGKNNAVIACINLYKTVCSDWDKNIATSINEKNMKKPICVHTMYVLTIITTNNAKSSQVWKIQQLPP